ncbi:autotransporter Vag8 [Bordetella bronchiseptica]|uniref:autotransporter Vag8 n=1 Tax=Bordetella bronchiseptica TaxID=518 RepID=UPI001248AFFA|nr:autotransporter Vag8 [Bordetella bronchiseptica]KAB1445706.1 autotransporter Vag8 [Bordetella bronchiseptica]KAB1572233.1 autotransporter Vag8 [Bordetella bronchiseptica]
MAGQARRWYGAGGRHPIHFQISAGAALMLGLLDAAGGAAVTAAQRIDGGAAFLGDVAIATTKASEHGINVTGRQAEVRVTGGAIRTSGNQAQGVRVGTENAQDNTALGASVSLQNLIIETAGTGALGVSVHEPQGGGGTRLSMSGTTVRTRGDDSFALQLSGPASATLHGVALETAGQQAPAVVLWQGAQLNAQGLVVQVDGAGVSAIHAQDAGSFTLSGSDITARGQEVAGIYVQEGMQGTLTGTRVTTQGDTAPALQVEDAGTHVSMNGGALSTSGANSPAAWLLAGGSAQFRDTVLSTVGEASHGVDVAAHSEVELAHAQVRAGGQGAHGLVVTRSSAMVRAGSLVESTGDGAAALLESGHLTVDGSVVHGHGAAGLEVDGESNVSLLNGARLSSDQPTAIRLIDPRSVLNLDIKDRAQLLGDIAAEPQQPDGSPEQARVRVALADGGTWAGRTDGAVHTVRLLDRGVWTVTGDSRVAEVKLEGGTLAFAAPAQPKGAFKTLVATQGISGTGTIVMNAHLPSGTADVLLAPQGFGDRQVLVVNNTDDGTESGASKVPLIEDEQGHTAFTLGNMGGRVDAGARQYELTASEAQADKARTWQLTPTNELSTTATAAVNAMAIAASQRIWQAEMDVLLRHMSGLHSSGSPGGFWARGLSQRQRLDTGYGPWQKQTVSGIELGIDRRVAGGATTAWSVGMLAGYSETRRDGGAYRAGHVHSAHVGAYVSYLNDSGSYVDGVVKYNRFRHGFDVRTTDLKRVDAKHRSHGLGALLRGGRRIDIDGGWYVEPQASVAWFHADGSRYEASNGLRVRADSAHSWVLRAGAEAGRQMRLANGNIVEPYARLGWAQELGADNAVYTNGIRHVTRSRGGFAEARVGVGALLGKRHALYADYEYAKGARFEAPWTLQLGYRYSW